VPGAKLTTRGAVRFTVAVGSIAVDDLATQLYVDPGDVCVILAALTVEPVEDMWCREACLAL
jgi:hypothetical protein